MSASDFDDAKSVESWWGWSETKRAVEFLFWTGEITVVRRKSSFERIYDLTERVIPAAVAASSSAHTAGRPLPSSASSRSSKSR